MSAERPVSRRRWGDRTDDGFTLVELLIALVLSGVIAGVIVAAMATSLNVASSTTTLVADSADAGLISTFLYRDAQAAGAVNPATTEADARAGVATVASTAGWANCAQTGIFVARFSWLDRESTADTRVVVSTYALDTARQLTRRVCQNGTTTDFVLSHSITSAVATCAPLPCGSATTSVRLTIAGSAARTPFTYTLEAVVRAGPQTRPASSNSSTVPLLALGGATGATPCPNLLLSGTGSSFVNVRGDVVVGSSCDASPIKGDTTRLVSTGSKLTLTGVSDPFITVPPPTTTCANGGTNATPIGSSSGPDTLTVYPTAVSITGTVAFAPGRYVFCAGLDIGVGATVSGSGVFFFVPAGTFSVNAAAVVQLAAPTSGPYANLLVWVATAQQVVVSSGPQVSNYAGYIYAPTSQITAKGAGYNNIGGMIAQGISFAETTRTRLGTVPSIAVTRPTMPGGQVAVAYPPTTLAVTGGTAQYTWSATGLPPGVALDPSLGVISGVPTLAGTSTVIVTVVDGTAAAASIALTIVVDPELGISGPTALATGQVGVATPPVTISPSGGKAPFRWSATGLPAGMTIDQSTGVVSGTPTVPATATVVVTVVDDRSATATRTYSLSVKPVLSVTPRTLTPGQVGVAYAATSFIAAGGTTPYTWSATGLPAGLTMNSSGTISGSPTVPGSFTVVARVNDSNTASATTSAALNIAPVLALSTTPLPGGQVGVVYPSTTLTPSGGTAPYTWSATGLPAGLTLNASTGVISGTPTASGTFAIVVTVDDASLARSTANYSITINPPLAVAGPATLSGGQVGVAYTSITFSPTGGTAPFRWTVTGLPAGLTVDPATGVLSGTPTAAGAFTVVATVTDARSASSVRSYPLTVNPILAVAALTMPSGRVGVAYTTTTASATGGTTPYAWSATGLPAGLTINASTGAITGTPTVAGSFTGVIKVTDAKAASATVASPITIAAALPAGCPANPTGWKAEYFNNITVSGVAALCRDDAEIDFDYGYSSPDPVIVVDGFSARWSRTQSFAAATYTFAMGSDDGSRLLIDGVLVWDRWFGGAYPSPVPTFTKALAAGTHTIVMEYYESGGPGRATLSWTSVTSTLCPAATGWQAEYYSNISLSGAVTACRDDASINFNWGTGSPFAGMPSDNFSVRWSRNQTFAAGTYRFALGSDDGGRLYIDGVLVIDVWFDQSYPGTPPSATRTLSSGQHTIVVEYYERGGDARATLGWS